MIDDTAKAVAAAYADAARIANMQELACAKWILAGYGTPIATEQCELIACAILARAAAVAADPALIGVEPWTPPPEADRPDGYKCLGRFSYGWRQIEWVTDARSWHVLHNDCDGAYVDTPTAFAPLPTVKGDGDDE